MTPRDDPRTTVRVDVLGPVRLVVDDKPVDVPGPKRCAVLAMLAMAEGRAVTTDRLVDALWPSAPPESGRAALHSHVSRLRGHLGPAAGRLLTVDGGYRLTLDRGDLDVERAQTLLATARVTRASDPATAGELLREALALWRGPAFAELTGSTELATMAAGVEHLHQEVSDLLIGCALDAGQVEGVVRLATGALAADPLREPAVLLLMRALAVTGQAPQALRTAREYRRRLAAETGLDPSAQLGDLEQQIAGGTIGHQDPRTAAPPMAAAAVTARPATRLIGREPQVTSVQRLLRTERLVTIVGPGGVGKTRIALELAWQAGAATVLPLARLTDPADIPHAFAAALGLREIRGDVLASCIATLGNATSHLLVIDNCEHLLDDTRELVTAVLDGCPEVSVLCTSREPLGLAAECPSRLEPLPLPPSGPLSDRAALEVAHIPSVAVFLERAARVRPGWTPGPEDLRLVALTARRLDGIPLALELAAGRLATMSLVDLCARLDRALDLLGSGMPRSETRHRTLRSTIAWSYDLLDSKERQLFRHLSVFPDGVDLSTAEYVTADLGLGGDPAGVLAKLVDASMMQTAFEHPTRYRMLETIRAFGLDRLAAAGEDGAAAERLVRWAVQLAAWIDASATTEREPDADAALRRELPTLRSAWHLARGHSLLDHTAALVIALSNVTSWRDLAETWAWAEKLADDPALADHPRAAEVLGCAASAAYMRGDYTRADQRAHAGLERASDAAGSWRCLSALSLADLSRGAYADALEHSLAAAALSAEPSENLGIAALALTYAGDLHQAGELNERMASLAVSPTLRAFAAYINGEIDNAAGAPDRGEEHYTRAIDLAHSSGASFLVGIAAVGLLTARTDAGRVPESLRGYRDVLDYWERSGNWTQLWVTLRNLAQLLRRLGDDEPAALLDAAAEQAPDAPPSGASPSPSTADAPSTPPATRAHLRTVGRAEALGTARRAIQSHLNEARQ